MLSRELVRCHLPPLSIGEHFTCHEFLFIAQRIGNSFDSLQILELVSRSGFSPSLDLLVSQVG
jgi:hypothetical protein